MRDILYLFLRGDDDAIINGSAIGHEFCLEFLKPATW
jgi:hypothetical protein